MASIRGSTGTGTETESSSKPKEKVTLVYSQQLEYDAGGIIWQAVSLKDIIISLEDIMQNALARVRNPALRQGLIFGTILGFILLVISFFSSGLTITLILCLLAAFIAGMRASQETGRITTGTLAGLWTGLIGIFIPSIISIVLLLINIDAVRKSAQDAANKLSNHPIIYTNSLLLGGLLINFVILLALGVLLGVLGGAIGGSFGRRRAPLPPAEEYHEAMFEPPSESQTEEPLSENSSEKPSSSTQPAE
jgi:hypothetical protein